MDFLKQTISPTDREENLREASCPSSSHIRSIPYPLAHFFTSPATSTFSKAVASKWGACIHPLECGKGTGTFYITSSISISCRSYYVNNIGVRSTVGEHLLGLRVQFSFRLTMLLEISISYTEEEPNPSMSQLTGKWIVLGRTCH